MKTYQPHKASIGNMDANTLSLVVQLAIVIGSFVPYLRYIAFAVGIVVFLVEKQSPLVKFTAIQACVWSAIYQIIEGIAGGVLVAVTSVAMATLSWGLLSVMAIITGVVTIALAIVYLVFSILPMVKAWKYTEYAIPMGVGKLSAFIYSKNPVVVPVYNAQQDANASYQQQPQATQQQHYYAGQQAPVQQPPYHQQQVAPQPAVPQQQAPVVPQQPTVPVQQPPQGDNNTQSQL